MNKSIVFFGTESISAVSLKALIDNGWQIEAVVTKPDSPRGRHGTPVAPLVKTIALENNIPVLQPAKVSELLDQPFNTSTAVLVSYGKIIPQSVIDLFPTGIINVHPSLLPKYRGPTPFQTAILNGDSETGVSLMRLVEAMDAGPVYAQVSHALDGSETAEELGQLLAQQGAQLLVDKLPRIIDGSLTTTPQNDVEAMYCRLFTKEMGIIDWYKSAVSLEREIRAYHEWPKSTAKLGTHEVIITKAHVVPTNHGEEPGTVDAQKDIGIIMVECGNGSLCIDRLKPVGRKEMTTKEFIAGYQL